MPLRSFVAADRWMVFDRISLVGYYRIEWKWMPFRTGKWFWRWGHKRTPAAESFLVIWRFYWEIGHNTLHPTNSVTDFEVQYESFYYNNNPIQVSPKYFDKNFVFDSRHNWKFACCIKTNKRNWFFPMLLRIIIMKSIWATSRKGL